MRQLDRKMLRDLWRMKTQFLAIVLVIASGSATFVMSLSVLASLEDSRTSYYAHYRFADLFTRLKRAPESLLVEIAGVPGMMHVESRIIQDVTLDVPGMLEPAVGRLVSLPRYGMPEINQLHLRRGRWLDRRSSEEVLVSEAFAEAHGLRPGDSIVAILHGRRKQLYLAGIVLSPEYIFQIREGDLLPDARRFGVFWMNYEGMAHAFDMDGAFNDVVATMAAGTPIPEILEALDNLTERYGGTGAYHREDQLSHRYISDELKQLRSMAFVAPLIFLSVSAFILHIVLTRLLETQREQIAALKAFGYTRLEIGAHYLKLVLVVVFLGVVIGAAAGSWLARSLTEMYAQFYRFPVFLFEVPLAVVFFAWSASGGAALLGVAGAIYRAMQLPPAEAMRPAPPASFRPSVIERLGLKSWFSHAARISLRQLERSPRKALLSVLGIALAVGILILGSHTEDAVDYVMNFEFFRTQRQDVTVTLIEPGTAGVRDELAKLPGVMTCETFRSVATRLRFGQHSRLVGIMGLPPNLELFRLMDHHERTVRLPADGLILSAKLGEILEIQPGDWLTVEVLEDERPVRQIQVVGLISDYAGLGAYMEDAAVHRLMREGATVSGAYLRVDPLRLPQFFAAVKQAPRIAGVNVKMAALRSFENTIAENLLRIRAFNVAFAAIIAFGVVYNTARIALAERSRELATLRVIGFTRHEVFGILAGELALITMVAIPLGLAIGYGFARFSTYALETETHRFPLVIRPATYAFATLVVVIAAVLSAATLRRRVAELDLIGVLKTKE